MSWLTDQYDKAVENNPIAEPFKRRRWDPVGDADAALSKVFGGGTSGDLEEPGKITANLSAGEVDPNARLRPLQDIHKKDYGRKFHNLNKRGGASILTTV